MWHHRNYPTRGVVTPKHLISQWRSDLAIITNRIIRGLFWDAVRISPSFYWTSVANAPNVLQPYWLILLPLDVQDLTANLLL